ncbi:sel1 repeat family protein [Chryseobacterium salipaludis]|uniref:tetratricopeptide repeat protein n=1 Tax=Chryseobacterium TaxID=59732 RepID=UPI001FF6E13F|nr:MULTISPECIES: tetratricopeptide repeat protein [Chryseobacterium]MCJ8498886.1 sel1 repeat family protein [Chryseobacterium salipaludis]MCX3295555.1 sel1 repeat family protein [Planobacterium sp. JC490]
MNRTFFLCLTFTFLIFQATYSQTAEELNKQSKKLLDSGKYQEAKPILKKAAELGNGEAQYNFGYLLQSGVLGERKSAEAIEWFKKSSDNNFNDGHYALMMAYGNGDGVEQNSEKAFAYAMKCAANNDPTCMWNVVSCYVTGNGVPQNIPKFKEWILRLAKLENPENLAQSGYITSSRLELAQFHKNGKYFDKDLYQSYLWYLIYNEYKVDFSILKQQETIEEIKNLEKLLEKSQIQKAPSDAEKLLGRKLKNKTELYKTTL